MTSSSTHPFALNVYVIHSKLLPLRKSLCDDLSVKLNASDKLKVDFKFIEEYDADAIPTNVVRDYVDLSPHTPAKEEKSRFDAFLKGLHVRHLSNALKHHAALKQAAAQSDANAYNLIVEDDVVFGEGVADRLLSIIETLEQNKEWDINFLGLPQPVSKETTNPTVVNVDTIFKVLPDISSYIIKKDAAQRLCDLFFPIRYMTNIHLSYLFVEKSKSKEKTPLRITMSTPNVFIDGSKFGVYLSSLLSNNKLILNQDYSKLYSIIVSRDVNAVNAVNAVNTVNTQSLSPPTYNEEEQRLISEMFDTIKFGTHPEFQVLRGVFETQIGNYEKAKSILSTCYETYKNNNCLLNGESEFIMHYARLFKYLQD